MQQRSLRSLPVSAIGFGAAGLSDDAASIATVRAAIDSGITLLDTGDFYDVGLNEELIARALRPGDRESVQLSVKFGVLRNPSGGFAGVEGRPAHVGNSLAYSLRRLRTDYVDIYRPARLDQAVPIEETVGAIAELVDAGYIRHIGLSEVGPETIRRAHAVHAISDVQIEYSLFSRGPERGIIDVCRELGIGVTAYGVLAHGLLTGSYPADQQGPAFLPRFSADNLPINLALVERLRPIADAHDISVAQLAVAWVLARGEHIVPLVGTSNPTRIQDAVAAVSVVLSAADLDAIEAAVPAGSVAGERYAPAQMATLDSEH